MIKGGKAMFGNFNFINTIKFNAYKIDKITTVKDLINELCEEANSYL